MKKAILYVRVSTDEQARYGYSLRDQEHRLRVYCDKFNLHIAAIYREDYSAKDFNRPEFKKLMQYVKDNKNKIDQLLFVRWDRFSRNVMESYQYIDLLQKRGIEPKAIEQPIDLKIPENKFMLSFFLTAPDVENARKSINTTQGIRRCIKEGRLAGMAPKGYINTRDENDKKTIVPNEDAKYIIEAFKEITKGLKPYDHVRQELIKKGFKCSKANFATIIRNPIYMGKLKLKAYMDEPEELVEGIHEPLVSPELFYQVQDILNGRNKAKPHPKIHGKKRELPLRGFVFCHKCGNRLTGSGSRGNGGQYFYYHCNHCKQVRFRADKADQKLLKKLQTYSIDKEYSKLFLKIFNDTYKQEAMASESSSKIIKDKIANLQKRINGLQDKFADDLINSTDYHEMKNRYEREVEQFKVQQAKAKVNSKEIQEMMQRALHFMENIDNHYSKAPLEVKQELIGSIFTGNLYFEDDRVRTTEVNKVIEMVCNNRKALQGDKKRPLSKNQQQSGQVAPRGIEPLSKV